MKKLEMNIKVNKNENLESKTSSHNYPKTFCQVAVIGTGLYATCSLISRYLFQSEEAANFFNHLLLCGIGYTVGGSLDYMFIELLKGKS